ncbi:MAG TPA: bifunctional phosphoribosylaminoimidazolecarboxamide formyltransferase/IMP cyclohydrolase [Gaiellales bacterium]|jgi:phosphoribosylaminoimidazolecarboxamide formyltransferase/IMP cyclohydrolase
MSIKRALISVSDKNGLASFASGLADLGIELISTSGTATLLTDSGLKVTTVEDMTGGSELLGGRVKTLHPHVHAGILARRNHPDDMASLEQEGIEPIDLVVCNLYPFRMVANRRGVTEPEVIANIDVGGPTMVRAAAKNYDSVAVVTDPERYGFILDELRTSGGQLSPETRRELAAEAFAHTAGYDAAISEWFNEVEAFPERVVLDLVKAADLPYGENPHQRAAYYVEAGARRHLLSMIEQLGGPPLSFNNLWDLQAARSIAGSFQVPACAIIKHATPCGVAVGATIEEAFERALESDTVAAFGGVIAVNRAVTPELAERMADQVIHVLFAPGYDDGAADTLRQKQALRILEDRERRKASPGERDIKRVLGGLLIQDRDTELDERDTMQVVSQVAPTEQEWGDLLFAWRVCKHVRSNAIVIARDLATVGIGGGDVSRVDAVRVAVEKAGGRNQGAVLASDAFFPFDDGPRTAVAAGVKAIIQPGGSKRDDEVIAAADEAGVAMVFTGRRHFLH